MRNIEIYINSYTDRLISEIDSTSKHFTILLEGSKEIRVYPDEKNITVKLGSIELPNVLYNFNFITSTLWIVNDYGGLNESLESITINTDRVYTTPEDVIEELNSLITTHPILKDIEFNYIDNEKKITITNYSLNNIRIVSSFRFNDILNGRTYNDINDRLGFIQDMKNIIIKTGETLKGEGLIKMLRTNCFYLTCNNIAGSYNQNIIPNPRTNRKILARLSTSDFGTLSQLSYPAQIDFNIINESSIRTMSFSLLDDEFNLVDLGQFPITFSLILSIS